MHRRAGFPASIVLAALILLVPQAGSAAQGGPPYTDSRSYASCGDLFGGSALITCSAAAVADRLTGALGMDLRLTSPLDGAVPGVGNAYGNGRITGLVDVKKEAPAVVILVTVHVASAQAATDVLAGAASGHASLYVWANAVSCSCYAGASRWLVDSYYGPQSRANEDVVVPLIVTDYDGDPIRPGAIGISVEAYGSTSMEDAGTARVLVDAVVTSIEIA